MKRSNSFFRSWRGSLITIYDPATTLLKSYIDSSDHPTHWQHCQAHLEEIPSLKEVLDKGRPRVINNMVTFENDGIWAF